MAQQNLERRVKELEKEIGYLKKKNGIERKTVYIDDTVSYKEVKKRVFEHMRDHSDKEFGSFELMEVLHLDPLLIHKALFELQEEGVIT
jgi:hypothetical protein